MLGRGPWGNSLAGATNLRSHFSAVLNPPAGFNARTSSCPARPQLREAWQRAGRGGLVPSPPLLPQLPRLSDSAHCPIFHQLASTSRPTRP